MRQILILSIAFVLPYSNCWSQANNDSTLFQHQKVIDSYILSFDTLKLSVQSELTGNLVFGPFHGSYFHNRSENIIYKIHFDFDTTTSKIIYFKDNKPIKIIDDQSEFYNIEQWVNKKGIVIESPIMDKLLLLAKESIDVVQKLFE